eukprot:14973776-Alexandrium_andersonii.AAC.1
MLPCIVCVLHVWSSDGSYGTPMLSTDLVLHLACTQGAVPDLTGQLGRSWGAVDAATGGSLHLAVTLRGATGL